MDDETAKHTPTPWRVVSGAIMKDDIPIAYMDREPGNGTLPVERDENADFIVRAVNSHAELLGACKAIKSTIGHADLNLPLIDAAIAKAEGTADAT